MSPAPIGSPISVSRGRLAYTNNGICGAFRGFGANQMVFAIEMPDGPAGRACGLDPVEIRRRNLREPGDRRAFSAMTVAPTERLVGNARRGRANPLWQSRAARSPEGRIIGVGMALHHQGTGLGSLPP